MLRLENFMSMISVSVTLNESIIAALRKKGNAVSADVQTDNFGIPLFLTELILFEVTFMEFLKYLVISIPEIPTQMLPSP